MFYVNYALNLKQVEEDSHEAKKPLLNVQMIFCIERLRTWKVDLIIKHLVKDKWSSWVTDSLNGCMLAGTPRWNLYFIFPTSSNLNRNGLMIVILPNHKKLKWRMSWNPFQVYISVIPCKGKKSEISVHFLVWCSSSLECQQAVR